VVWEFLASSDYDPCEDLEKIVAPLLAVNFADDLINASGFADLDATMQRVRRGSGVIIDAGARAGGHKTLAKAEVWNTHVRDLLESSQPMKQSVIGSEVGLVSSGTHTAEYGGQCSDVESNE
jgi:homoserine O-acetyltransferase